MRPNQKIYVVCGTDVHATTVKKFDGKWLDIEPIRLGTRGGISNVLEKSDLWRAYERKGAVCDHIVRVYLNAMDAYDMVEKKKLVSEIKPHKLLNRSISVLRKIKEILGND